MSFPYMKINQRKTLFPQKINELAQNKNNAHSTGILNNMKSFNMCLTSKKHMENETSTICGPRLGSICFQECEFMESGKGET